MAQTPKTSSAPSPPQAASGWHFPLEVAPPSAKQSLRLILGSAFIRLKPELAATLEKHGSPASRIQRWMMEALVLRHTQAGTLDRLTHHHKAFWASDEAHAYHEVISARRGGDFILDRHRPMLRAFVDQIEGTAVHTVVELGCGTGALLRYLAQQLPSPIRIVGVDLSPSQIASNQKHPSAVTLEYQVGDMTTWIPRHASPGWAYLFYGGVLEYLSQGELMRLIRSIAERGPCCIALAEPIGDYKIDEEVASRTYGTEASFAHNYPRLLRDAGFTVRYQLLDEPSEACFVALVASRP